MNILVTGSSGFIGFHLIKKLIDLGYNVHGIDNHSNFYSIKLKQEREQILSSKNYKFLKSDINNLKIIEERFDLAINLAAQPGVRVKEEHKNLYQTTNVKGFENFCLFCKQNNINKIIYASSSSVYSDLNLGKFSEESVLEPKSEYGLSKLENELFASKFSKNYSATLVGLRFFSVYGPFGRPDMAYYVFTEALKKNNTINLHNCGLMARDMTFIDDIIQGILGAMNFIFRSNNEGKHEIFNLGNDNPLKTIEVLETIEKKLNKKANIKYVETKNEAFKTHANIEKAKKLLSYEPKVCFNEGIESFLEWHKHYGDI